MPKQTLFTCESSDPQRMLAGRLRHGVERADDEDAAAPDNAVTCPRVRTRVMALLPSGVDHLSDRRGSVTVPPQVTRPG